MLIEDGKFTVSHLVSDHLQLFYPRRQNEMTSTLVVATKTHSQTINGNIINNNNLTKTMTQ